MDIDFSILWNETNDNSANISESTRMPSEASQSPEPINYTPLAQNAVQSLSAPSERELLFEQAVRIVKDYKQKRAAAEGIMRQIEQDIGKQDPMLLLLFAAEALDRMSGGGDSYIKRLEEKAAAAGIEAEPYKF